MSLDLEQFLFDAWGTEEGTIFFAQKRTEKLFKVGKPAIWPRDKDNILGFISMSNAQWDTYFTPGIFKPDSETKDKENGLRAKCLWVDLDGYKEGQASPQEALQAIRSTGWLPEPTYRIQTSAKGEHWYWILEDYVDAKTHDNINRRLTYFLNADKACWDISHVMRPPTTHNHKEVHKVQGVSPQVTVAYFSEQIHSIDIFDKLPQIKEQINDLIVGTEIPDVQDVLMKYPWDDNHIELFRKEKQEFWNDDSQDYNERGNAMMRLSYFGAEIGMSDEALYSVLLDADNRWGKFKDRHDRQIRLVEMISKTRQKYPHALVTEYSTNNELRAVYGFQDFLATEYKFEWIYDQMVPKNGINFISARPGVGKSRFILNMMKCLALGEDFLGWKLIGEPRKVLLMSLEMGPPVLKKFMESLSHDSGLDDSALTILNTNFLVIPAGEPLAINSAEGEQFFRQVMGDHNPAVVFIDAMGSLDLDELSEAASKKIMNKLKSFLNEFKDVTFYLVHHNKKTDAASINKPPTLNDFYGNTYAATDAASVMALWKNPQKSVDEVELHTLKHRIGLQPEPIILDSRSKFTFSVLEHSNDAGPSTYEPVRTKRTSSSEAEPKPDSNAFGFNL